MQLDISKVLLGLYIPGLILYRHTPIGIQMPGDLTAVPRHDPLIKTAAVEKYDGITGDTILTLRVNPGWNRLVNFGFFGFCGFRSLIFLVDDGLRPFVCGSLRGRLRCFLAGKDQTG